MKSVERRASGVSPSSGDVLGAAKAYVALRERFKEGCLPPKWPLEGGSATWTAATTHVLSYRVRSDGVSMSAGEAFVVGDNAGEAS